MIYFSSSGKRLLIIVWMRLSSSLIYLHYASDLFVSVTAGHVHDLDPTLNRNSEESDPSRRVQDKRVVFAVNAGGDEHTDIHGIFYQKDPIHAGSIVTKLNEKIKAIVRVPQEDQILFQSKRVGMNAFGYDIPIPVKDESSYVLVLMFSETSTEQRKTNVFDVILNGHHKILSKFDILSKTGFGTAHQEVVPFVVALGYDGPLLEVEDGESDIENGIIRLDFVSSRGSSSVNAFYVIKGVETDVIPLPKLRSVDIPRSKQIYAVNCGGEAHTDIYGISYQTDYLQVGIASKHGMMLEHIQRVHHDDEILYRSERYSATNFGYSIPIKDDGSYVLVMKFSEVWFQSPGQKIFDVTLNQKHLIVPGLDIFSEVGWGTAHDVIISFSVGSRGSILILKGVSSQIQNGKIYLEFQKGNYDNPKINAFYVIRGTPEDVPPMPNLHVQNQIKKPPVPTTEEEDWGLDDDQNGETDWEFEDADFTEELPFDELPSDRMIINDHDPWGNASLLSMISPLIVSMILAAVVLYLICVKFRPQSG